MAVSRKLSSCATHRKKSLLLSNFARISWSLHLNLFYTATLVISRSNGNSIPKSIARSTYCRYDPIFATISLLLYAKRVTFMCGTKKQYLNKGQENQ